MTLQTDVEGIATRLTGLRKDLSSSRFDIVVDTITSPESESLPARFEVGEVSQSGQLVTLNCIVRSDSPAVRHLREKKSKSLRQELYNNPRIIIRGFFEIDDSGALLANVDYLRFVGMNNHCIARRLESFELANRYSRSDVRKISWQSNYNKWNGKSPYKGPTKVYNNVALIVPPKSRAYKDFLDGCKKARGINVNRVPVGMDSSTAISDICDEIVRQDQALDGEADLIAVCRGGGGPQSRAVFDAPEIVETIAGCSHDVATGIGHFHDFHASDLVASFSQATPSLLGQEVANKVWREKKRTERANRDSSPNIRERTQSAKSIKILHLEEENSRIRSEVRSRDAELTRLSEERRRLVASFSRVLLGGILIIVVLALAALWLAAS